MNPSGKFYMLFSFCHSKHTGFRINSSFSIRIVMNSIGRTIIIFMLSRLEKFFGDNLFRDWRYRPDGTLNEEFVLNNPMYGGEILVAGKNFGSGSLSSQTFIPLL